MKKLMLAASLLLINQFGFAGACATAFTSSTNWLDTSNNIQATVTSSYQGMALSGTFKSLSTGSDFAGSISGTCVDQLSQPIQLNVNITAGHCAGTTIFYIMSLNGYVAKSIGPGVGKGSCALELMNTPLNFIKQ